MKRSLACWLALWLLPLAACPAADSESGDVPDDGPPLAGAAECVIDEDCVAAGSSCCECPTFALPASSGWESSCEEVGCPAPTGCATTEVACEAGSCVLRCQPVQCDTVCDSGFAADEMGCLVCPSSASDCPMPDGPAPTSCEADSECVEVPADCCGCALGGVDTAVPSWEVDGFLGGFGCDDEPDCPGVDVCDSSLVPRCIGGDCQLAEPAPDENGGDAGAGPAPSGGAYCGTSDYPACPEGMVCCLNDPAYEDANAAGVGVCQTGPCE